MYYVYALKSLNNNYIYVGLTSNIENRLKRHNTGRERTTRPYKPFKIIKIDKFDTRIEARQREKYLKSGCGKELLKKIE